MRRHAPRDPTADRLTPAGQALAQRVGRELEGPYDAVFCSEANRAAETVAWLLRGLGHQLPEAHSVVPGLGGGGPAEAGATLAELMDRVPEGRTGLAVGHTPLIEQGVEFLTGTPVSSLAPCEGVVVVEEGGRYRVERELRVEP